MIFVLSFHIALSAIAGILAWVFLGPLVGLSLAAGAAVSLLNLVGLSVAWTRILAKKQVALAISVIVFKFAILGWILFEVARAKYLNLMWFSLGMALIVVTAVVGALKFSNSESANNEQ